MAKPTISDDPLYLLLREENIELFNTQREQLDNNNLKGGDYRGLDLRKINPDGLDFSDGYFRNSDLRGLDLRNTNLEGANIRDANISGVYFPKQLTAAEIRMSIEFGTRLRYRNS